MPLTSTHSGILLNKEYSYSSVLYDSWNGTEENNIISDWIHKVIWMVK